MKWLINTILIFFFLSISPVISSKDIPVVKNTDSPSLDLPIIKVDLPEDFIEKSKKFDLIVNQTSLELEKCWEILERRKFKDSLLINYYGSY